MDTALTFHLNLQMQACIGDTTFSLATIYLGFILSKY